MKNPECERAVVHVTNNIMIMVATPPLSILGGGDLKIPDQNNWGGPEQNIKFGGELNLRRGG